MPRLEAASIKVEALPENHREELAGSHGWEFQHFIISSGHWPLWVHFNTKSSGGCRGQGSGCLWMGGRHKCSLRSRLREFQPIQPRIQPILWPTSHARCQGSSSEYCCRCM